MAQVKQSLRIPARCRDQCVGDDFDSAELISEVKAMFAILGKYDLLFIAEFPGVDKAMQFSVSLSKLTGIAFTTFPAVTVAEFDKLMVEV